MGTHTWPPGIPLVFITITHSECVTSYIGLMAGRGAHVKTQQYSYFHVVYYFSTASHKQFN